MFPYVLADRCAGTIFVTRARINLPVVVWMAGRSTASVRRVPRGKEGASNERTDHQDPCRARSPVCTTIDHLLVTQGEAPPAGSWRIPIPRGRSIPQSVSVSRGVPPLAPRLLRICLSMGPQDYRDAVIRPRAMSRRILAAFLF